MIELVQDIRELSPLFYATTERLILKLAPGETGGNYKLSIRALPDPNTVSMCDADGVESDGKVTFTLNTFTQEFKRVCDKINTSDGSAKKNSVWLEIYDTRNSRVLLQRQIEIACRAATLDGQPSAPVESYLKIPAGGNIGQVLKKTAAGTGWGDAAAQLQADWLQSDSTAADFIKNKPEFSSVDVSVGPCTALGRIVGAGTLRLSWADPDDVELNGAVLATWVKTVLVRKNGAFPASHTDGTEIAVTDRAAGTKNQYRDNGYEDTPPAGETPYYALFSLSSAGVWNALAANWMPTTQVYSWFNVEALVQAGVAAQHFPVGTVFEVPDGEYSHTDGTGLLWRVLGHDQVPAQDESLVHTMCVGMIDCPFNAPYDAAELLYALTADTVAVAGKVYYTLSGSTYTALAEGVDWNAGDPVPIASWYEKNLDGRTNGSNNAAQSNMIQWLNSSGFANGWFGKQTIWDQCSSALLAKNGFCKHLDPDFLAVVKPAKLTTATYPAGSITHYAKFWALSQTQVFGTTTGGVTENVQLAFYSGGGEKRKTLMNSTAYTYWWLRSPNTAYPDSTLGVQPSGTTSNTRVTNVCGVSPACIIA